MKTKKILNIIGEDITLEKKLAKLSNINNTTSLADFFEEVLDHIVGLNITIANTKELNRDLKQEIRSSNNVNICETIKEKVDVFNQPLIEVVDEIMRENGFYLENIK